MMKTDLEWMCYVMHHISDIQSDMKNRDCPIFAVLVHENRIIAEAQNMVELLSDATMHSEMICISRACRALQIKNLSEMTMYCSHEPCKMCIEAMKLAKVGRVIFGSFRLNDYHMKLDMIGGVFYEHSSGILTKFFRQVRVDE